jgi:pimeloyl-ACP methyl ester carboxylesterase
MARASFVRQVFAASRWRAPATVVPPLLVLASANDRLCDPGCPQRIAEHYGATLAVHPDAGHDLSVDDPDWFIAQIAGFGAAA